MSHEQTLIAQGLWPLCGVDEAGRGPLAGPVVAAAVILEPDSSLRERVRDSKKLTPRRREQLYAELLASADVRVGVGVVSEQVVDEINILQATFRAMQQAVDDLGILPLCALVDGNATPHLPCRSIAVVKGDITEASISAASIVAKVTRDHHMFKMDELYPGYGFAKHKGYPTRAHYEAIRNLGPSPIHRRSFRGVVERTG